MIKLVGYSNASAGIREFVADFEADLENMPQCEMGSTVLVIDTSAIYIKNGEGEWIPFGG